MRKAKHIEFRYHFVRHLVSPNVIEKVNIPSKENIADRLTKPLDKILLWKFHDRLWMINTGTHLQGEC